MARLDDVVTIQTPEGVELELTLAGLGSRFGAALIDAVLLGALVPLVADRSPRAWFAFGGIGAVLMNVARAAARMPLGLSADLTWRSLAVSVLLTAFWCGLVGWLLTLDLPQRLRARRARKLR